MLSQLHLGRAHAKDDRRSAGGSGAARHGAGPTEGTPFSELVRQAIESRLESSSPRVGDDPLFDDVPVFEGAVPPNLSEDHDTYLYGEMLRRSPTA